MTKVVWKRIYFKIRFHIELTRKQWKNVSDVPHFFVKNIRGHLCRDATGGSME